MPGLATLAPMNLQVTLQGTSVLGAFLGVGGEQEK